MLSHSADQSTPDALYNGLPESIREQRCKCTKPTNETFYRWWSASIEPADANRTIMQKVLRRPPMGMYCTTCMRYTKYTITNAVRECDGCANYYLPEIKDSTWPIKYFLCKECDVDVPTRPRRSTR